MKWGKRAAIEFFEGIISVFIASEAYEASLLSVLWYIKQCGGTKIIFSETNGAQERKFIGGSQQISEKLAEKLDNVILDSPVYEINQESREVVVVRTTDGKEYKVKYVILAVPPILQMKIHFKPSLPPLKNQLMQRVPMGSVMKAILYYETPFWREKGFCGSFLLEGDDSCPVFFTLDDTKPDGSCPAIVGFICADKCRRILSLSPQERKVIVAKSYAKATGCSEFLEPVHYEEKNWLEEQYSGGCYTAVYPPGFFTRYGKHMRTPVDRLFFAGTETAIKWSGYMDGAVEAGERAAREILHELGKIRKDQIWVEEPQHKDVITLPFPESYMEKYSPSVPSFLKIVTCSLMIGISTIAILKCPKYR